MDVCVLQDHPSGEVDEDADAQEPHQTDQCQGRQVRQVQVQGGDGLGCHIAGCTPDQAPDVGDGDSCTVSAG